MSRDKLPVLDHFYLYYHVYRPTWYILIVLLVGIYTQLDGHKWLELRATQPKRTPTYRAYCMSVLAIKLAFHGADTDILADILARIVARMSACRSACRRNNFRKSRVSDVSARILAMTSMSVSVSASWNSSLTLPASRRRIYDVVCTTGLHSPISGIYIFSRLLAHANHGCAYHVIL